VNLNRQELGAVLAGLWLLQKRVWDAETWGIASDNETVSPLTDEEIDKLCERLSTLPDVPEWAFDIAIQLAEQNLAPDWDDDTAGQRVLQEEALDLVRDYLHQHKIWR